jgi:hypothetical protein
MSKDNLSAVLSKRLVKLEVETTELYTHLVGTNEIDFTKGDSLCETLNERINDLKERDVLEWLPMTEMHSESTGNVFSVYVAHITNDAIICVDVENRTIRTEDRYKNIHSIEDNLIIINEIEEYLNK